MLSTIIKVTVSIAVVETSFATASVVAIVPAVEATRETTRVMGLVLRRTVEIVVGSWIWEVRIDSWRTLVVDGFSAGGFAEEPRGVLGLLHGVRSGRGGRAR